MMKSVQIIASILLIPFLYVSMRNIKSSATSNNQQKNHPPVVKIVNPKNQGIIQSTTMVNYSITVSDKEDGESKYDEINTKEVLLEVRHITDTTKLAALLNLPLENDVAGLGSMRTSNCFNCHGFDSKIIGPSFNDIGKKYTPTAANIALLQKHVLEGSTGIWGKVTMPSHPELSKEQALNMAQWILKATADPMTNYYTGTEGSFRIAGKGTYLLNASYTDHGEKEDSSHRYKGEDKIIIYSR
jgi:cytochrome c